MSVTIKGSEGVTFPDASEQETAARTKTLSVDQFMHVQDQKPSNTGGGTFTAGSWQTRDLNTVLTNTIAGASLSANAITLPEGEYYLEASAPAFRVERHQARIGGALATLLSGTNELASVSDVGYTRSNVWGVILVGSGGETIEIQHRCQTTRADDGFGDGLGDAFPVAHELYSDIKIWKVA